MIVVAILAGCLRLQEPALLIPEVSAGTASGSGASAPEDTNASLFQVVMRGEAQVELGDEPSYVGVESATDVGAEDTWEGTPLCEIVYDLESVSEESASGSAESDCSECVFAFELEVSNVEIEGEYCEYTMPDDFDETSWEGLRLSYGVTEADDGSDTLLYFSDTYGWWEWSASVPEATVVWDAGDTSGTLTYEIPTTQTWYWDPPQ